MLSQQAPSANAFALLQVSRAHAVREYTDLSGPSQTNTSSLGVPSAFKVEPSWEADHPIDSTAFYMNGIELLYRLSDDPLSKRWDVVGINWENYGLEIVFRASAPPEELSAMTTQHIVWGISYIAFYMTLTGRYTALTAVLKWEGEAVGNLQIQKAAPTLQEGTSVNGTDVSNNLLLTNTTELRTGKEYIEITVYFSTSSIDENDIFLTALRALGDAMEAGIDTFTPAQFTIGIRNVVWFLGSEMSRDSKYLLKYRHSIEAIRQTISQMVSMNKFRGVIVIVHVNAMEVAQGGLEQKTAPNSMVDR